MTGTPGLPKDLSIESLRKAHYNATVAGLRRVHDELLIFQVEPDRGPVAYEPGQYMVLGLGYWEPRLAGTQEESLTEKQRTALARRAYSISSPVLDDEGKLARAGNADPAPGRTGSRVPGLEFYVSLVRYAEMQAPALTPRLFLLEEGDRLFLGPHVHGHYTLAPVKADDHVLFAATGTGEAPHNGMIAELLARGQRGNIASIVCVRYRRDLGYLAQHHELERRFSNYHYITLTTREPENIDPTHPLFVGKQYVQDVVASHDFESMAQVPLDPASTHVFLCGNPDMIGAPHHPFDLSRRFPVKGGMVELLETRGFTVDRPDEPGNVHFENYW